MLTARAPAAIAMATPIAQQVILPTVTRLAPLAARLATRGLHQAPRAIASTQPVTTSAANGKGVRGMRTAAACWPSTPMPDASRTRAASGANIQRHLHGSHRHSSGGGGFAGGGPFKGQSFEEFMGFPMPPPKYVLAAGGVALALYCARNSVLMTDAGVTYVVQNQITGSLEVYTVRLPPSLQTATLAALHAAVRRSASLLADFSSGARLLVASSAGARSVPPRALLLICHSLSPRDHIDL